MRKCRISVSNEMRKELKKQFNRGRGGKNTLPLHKGGRVIKRKQKTVNPN